MYSQILLAIAGGLLTLLGSVGIFISLIVQRRLEKLQDILEEFINLSYRSETNLTGLMYNLIEKYQMHYLFPRQPRMMILLYIDLNIAFILLLWAIILYMYYVPPFCARTLLYLVPMGIGIFAGLFFRRLLRNTINLENPLLDTIIPAPARLRSISYLSHFVNLSVKSVLKQARLTLLIVDAGDKKKPSLFQVYLKEELSFDDFFYFLLVSGKETETPYFVAYGEVHFRFLPDPITGKPIPVRRNVNVPLGEFTVFPGEKEDYNGKFLVFTRGEKHPIQYTYKLERESSYLASESNPEMTVNHQIIYTVKDEKVVIIQCDLKIPYFCETSPGFKLNSQRYYLAPASSGEGKMPPIQTCKDDVFIR